MRAPRDAARPPLVPTDPATVPAAAVPVWSPTDRTPNPGRGPRGEVLPFRRRRGLPVRRRSRLVRLVRPFLKAVAIVGVPAAALWWSGTSPRFALADLEVRGSGRVSEAWVRDQLAGLVGRNLVWMPLDSVERTLSSHPWVAGAEVTKELPSRLRVVVVERQPVAVLATADGRFWLGADGGVIGPVEGGAAAVPAPEPMSQPQSAPPDALLEVRWVAGTAGTLPTRDPDGAPGVDSDADSDRGRRILVAALDAAKVLETTAPEWGRALAAVEVLGDEELRLEGDGVPFPLLVRSGGTPGALDRQPQELATRLRRLEEILPELLAREPEPASVDLRFRNRIVVRPVVAATALTAERQKRGA